MNDRSTSQDLQSACDTIIAETRRLMTGRTTPLLVAIDGGSGAGKTTLAAMVRETLDAVVIPFDDFYAAHIPDAEWDRRTPEERADAGLDWRRMRAEALEPLLTGKQARWRMFDFEAGPNPDGTYGICDFYMERDPADVIIVDGAYSSRSELSDLIDLTILIDVPLPIRHARLASREKNSAFLAAWHARWDKPEAYYFNQVRPKSSFDLVVSIG